MALENYVMGIALSSFNKGITLTDITDEAIYIVLSIIQDVRKRT